MIRNVTKIFILSTLFVSILAGDLQAEHESKVKKTSQQSYAYLYSKKLKRLTEYLQRENIEVCELREDLELDVDVFHINRTEVTTEYLQETRRFRAGTILVKANQKSGDKVKAFLAPNSKKQKKNAKTLRPA